MKKILAGLGLLIVVAGLAIVSRFEPKESRSASTPVTIEHQIDPVVIPAEPSPFPTSDRGSWSCYPWDSSTGPGCEDCRGCLAYCTAEDEALVLVLRSSIEDDELFGTSVRTMEAAECAARRWRLEGR